MVRRSQRIEWSPRATDSRGRRCTGDELRRPHYLNAFLGDLKRRVHLELIDRWGGVPSGGRILKTDVFEESMGPDAFLHVLAASAKVAIGMDASVDTVARAQRRDPALRSCFVVADVRRLPFAPGSFALVISPSTLDHFADPGDLGRSLRELADVLQPGGRLIVTLDNRQNIFDPLLRLAHRAGWVPFYLGRSYRIGELCRALEAAGFRVEDTTAILHNPRLTAVASVAIAQRLNWPPLTRGVERLLLAAQRLERTPLCYFTGSFIAAKAIRQA